MRSYKGNTIYVHSLDRPLFLKEGGDKFWLTLPKQGEGGSQKLKKGDGSMVQGKVFLKGRGGGRWHFSYLIFSKFIIFTLEITLSFAKLCYAFEEKLFFSATLILRKKAILKCLKVNLKNTP